MVGRVPILREPEQHNVTFEKAQWKAIQAIAKREKISIHEAIRRAVEAFAATKNQQVVS
jgi:predicted DNA-binding ribbon-helix-helix protein